MLAIIPARGGSKGLERKNTKPLLGKPLIAYSIEAALKSKKISEVIVSTEDQEIAQIARDFGASVPFMRPDKYATDESLSIDTYVYTIDKIKSEFGIDHQEFVVLQPTSPLRRPEDIDSAIDLFHTKNADSVISFTEEHHSIFWHKYLSDNGKLSPIFENEKLTNRQELKKTYYPNGSIYVFKSKIIREGKNYTNNTFAYLMGRNQSVDIDTIEDFEFAEYLLSKL